ncbi:MAG TPA: hypothetical protein VEJ18_03780 [Planctomycetota bacterium]|nr:hypothetical protein [Planctomycetota bacterium]
MPTRRRPVKSRPSKYSADSPVPPAGAGKRADVGMSAREECGYKEDVTDAAPSAQPPASGAGRDAGRAVR